MISLLHNLSTSPGTEEIPGHAKEAYPRDAQPYFRLRDAHASGRERGLEMWRDPQTSP